ncbi:hypothetical protein GCM10010251_67850 [Streptomyces aurantiogriseus]|uniref:Uncharacterized protein n=1 Tax=Streptomyces aurantiogriseus TaxID=66870 RepID=A0A918FJ79_9ACTN|nr:hypothetical protein GCM10010251_67850 [Streptomyces aurantiogriseus]
MTSRVGHADRGERGAEVGGEGEVVEAHERDVAGDVETGLAQGGRRAGRHHVGAREHRREGQAGVQCLPGALVARDAGERAGDIQFPGAGHAVGAQRVQMSVAAQPPGVPTAGQGSPTRLGRVTLFPSLA